MSTLVLAPRPCCDGAGDAAGGDDVVVLGPQGVDRVDDLLLDIGHDARLAKIDAVGGQVAGDGGQVGVLGAARENLITDDHHGGGHAFAGGDRLDPLLAPIVNALDLGLA